MDLQDIKQFLETNKENVEVKTYLDSFKVEIQPTLEVFKNKIETDKEFKSFIDSANDTYFKKAHRTWEENNLEKLINDEVKKRFPEKDEKEILIEQLKAENEKMKKEALFNTLKNKALEVANEKGLPVSLIDRFVGEDENSTKELLDTLAEAWTKDIDVKVQEKVDERFNNNKHIPPENKDKGTNDNPYSKVTWSLSKQAELELSNPILAKQLQEQANQA